VRIGVILCAFTRRGPARCPSIWADQHGRVFTHRFKCLLVHRCPRSPSWGDLIKNADRTNAHSAPVDRSSADAVAFGRAMTNRGRCDCAHAMIPRKRTVRRNEEGGEATMTTIRCRALALRYASR
jgi:hypothetical protein